MKMTKERAVATLTKHLDAVQRGDPKAIALDREVSRIFKARQRRSEARRRRIRALTRALEQLSDASLVKLEGLVEELPKRRKKRA